MKRIFFVLLLIILLSIAVSGQPQLENNMENDFRTVGEVAKQIVGWFFTILIIIFGISATVMNLSRKNKKTTNTEES